MIIRLQLFTITFSPEGLVPLPLKKFTSKEESGKLERGGTFTDSTMLNVSFNFFCFFY